MLMSQKNIKMVIFDHITSASAVVMPIKKLAALCTKHNVLSVVDGAHAPGQMYLQVESYGVDIYIGKLYLFSIFFFCFVYHTTHKVEFFFNYLTKTFTLKERLKYIILGKN